LAVVRMMIEKVMEVELEVPKVVIADFDAFMAE
jgi:hypothetical protein